MRKGEQEYMQVLVDNITAIKIINWYNNEDTRNKLSKLLLKMQWDIRRNMMALQSLTQAFNTFRNELMEKRDNEWFVEGNGKCEVITMTDDDGDEYDTLKILDEYKEDLKAYEDDLNQQLLEILQEKNKINVVPVDIDRFIEMADKSGANFTIDDLYMIMVFSEENDNGVLSCEEDE